MHFHLGDRIFGFGLSFCLVVFCVVFVSFLNKNHLNMFSCKTTSSVGWLACQVAGPQHLWHCSWCFCIFNHVNDSMVILLWLLIRTCAFTFVLEIGEAKSHFHFVCLTAQNLGFLFHLLFPSDLDATHFSCSLFNFYCIFGEVVNINTLLDTVWFLWLQILLMPCSFVLVARNFRWHMARVWNF